MPQRPRRGPARRWAGALLALALVVTLVAPRGAEAARRPFAVAPPPAAAVATRALPSQRLEFGLSSGPDQLDWMVQSAVPWAYRFQYLAGNVLGSTNWPTWQDPALPPGQFALDYANASRQHGYIPVLTWYEMLQSSRGSGDERARDVSAINDATVMRTYYADWTLLMQRLAQYGGQAVVHVEPDMWGYLQMTASGGDASSLSASVASSGAPEAAGIPNTVAGFADTLLRVRDRVAPNVTMAIHASAWATNRDITLDTDPTLDMSQVGGTTAAFLDSAGITSNPYGSTWDAVFNDLDDHTAGWWEQNGRDHWWDPSNRTLPNFARYLQWVAALHAGTGRPQVAWQVPMGNQHFLTEDNTCGHYQDNVAEYFLAHPDQLTAAGLIAVMFGPGNACQTSYDDSRGDGVTNGPGHATDDAASFCHNCNTATSTVADDDGGYLRLFVGAYYRSHPVVPPTSGYWLVASDGGIFPFGNAAGLGSTGGIHLNRAIVGMASTPASDGYWLVASDGGVFPFGRACGCGSTGGIHLNQPIVGMAAAPSGRGYWLVASDGGIFPFGDAQGGLGSTGGIHLNQPVVGMAPTRDGRGYWLVASDGGIFPFGDAGGYGSTGGIHLNRPIVGMAATPSGRGYWLVASDGGIFPFGDARGGLGSTGGMHLNQPIVGMAATRDGGGYWLVASDGGIFTFGDAGGWGSMGGSPLNQPVVGMART